MEIEPLSDRERQLLFCLVEGKSLRETAAYLGLTRASARVSLGRIAKKLRCRKSVTGVVVAGLIYGVCPLPPNTRLLRRHS